MAFLAAALPAFGQADVQTGGHGEPELIFLSDPAAPPDTWDHVVARFEVAYRCHVVAPLAVGELDQQAETVTAYLRAQGLVRPVLIGHGAGGNVALAVAIRAPELPGRLVLVDCLPFPGATLGKVRCPTRVLGTLADPAAATRQVFRREYRGLSGVRFRFFPRAEHFVMQDDLEGFTDALRDELTGR